MLARWVLENVMKRLIAQYLYASTAIIKGANELCGFGLCQRATVNTSGPPSHMPSDSTSSR